MTDNFNIENVRTNAGNAYEALFNTNHPDEVMAAYGILTTWYHRELSKWVKVKEEKPVQQWTTGWIIPAKYRME